MAVPESRIQLANKLLEVGQPEEALASIALLSANVDVSLVRSDAYAAQGKYEEAIRQCVRGFGVDPKSSLLRLRCTKWRAESEAKGKVN
jgi:hypothetical protein